jgi:hypothetical protein
MELRTIILNEETEPMMIKAVEIWRKKLKMIFSPDCPFCDAFKQGEENEWCEDCPIHERFYLNMCCKEYSDYCKQKEYWDATGKDWRDVRRSIFIVIQTGENALNLYLKGKTK